MGRGYRAFGRENSPVRYNSLQSAEPISRKGVKKKWASYHVDDGWD